LIAINAGRRGTSQEFQRLEIAGAALIKPVRLFYATRDGQSRRIALRLQERLAERAIATNPLDLADGAPAAMELAGAALVVLVAAVRYGRHLAEADRFLAAYSVLPAPPPLVLVSVNLTARKAGKDTPDGNPYLRKLIARHRLHPVLAAAIGGRLDYARYGFFDRQMIRFIMMLTGGPTDPRACIDYASPAAIDDVAARIADLCGA
jgi:menaquinone-dependent protoporphyrinogen oxidase